MANNKRYPSAVNYERLSFYNPKWELDKVVLFDHLLYRLIYERHYMEYSTAQFKRFIRIPPKRLKTLLDFFVERGYIKTTRQQGGTTVYELIPENIINDASEIFSMTGRKFEEFFEDVKMNITK